MSVARETGPLTDRFDLMGFTDSLIVDLQMLRAGKISTKDAMARAELAKHVLRSVGYVITAQKYLSENAQPMKELGHGGGA